MWSIFIIINDDYLLYTILYCPAYSVASNLVSNLMIANSKITVFPDPVGADTTIDASVNKCYSCYTEATESIPMH